MSIRRITAVARREYLETIKTKAFLFGVLIMPGLIIGMIFISTRMTVQAARAPGTIRVAVVDHSGRVAPEMEGLATQAGTGRDYTIELEVVPIPQGGAPVDLEPLKQRVRDGSLFGLIELPADAPESDASCTFYLGGPAMDARPGRVQHLLQEAAKRIRFAEAGIDVEKLETLSRPLAVTQRSVRQAPAAGPRQDEMSRMMTPFAFVFLSFMGIFGVSQGLLTSVIEEKSSRVVEVLLSALSPFELMAGKIIGMAGVGMTMIVLWSGVGYAAAVLKDATFLLDIARPGQFILYYVLGYLLISSMLAALGSSCTTLKEAQPMMAPLTMMLVVPMMFWLQIVNEPNGALAVSLSFVPPMTPFIMILRLASASGEVPLWQQVVVPIWLALWVLIGVWAAGRVFRVGLLMYGKAPGLRELARWVRYA